MYVMMPCLPIESSPGQELAGDIFSGVYIVHNTMARGGGNGAGEKNEKWGSGEQNEKEGKRGKEKEEKEKGESDFFC